MRGASSTSNPNDIDYLGVLITAAHGLDDTWMALAACKDHSNGTPGPTPWQVDTDRLYGSDGKMTGRELIKAALMVCHACPVQYDCARYAAEGLMRAGTWAMKIGDLRWLQRQGDALRLIDIAEAEHIPMQNAAVEVRFRRAGISS